MSTSLWSHCWTSFKDGISNFFLGNKAPDLGHKPVPLLLTSNMLVCVSQLTEAYTMNADDGNSKDTDALQTHNQLTRGVEWEKVSGSGGTGRRSR